jgi:type II secretory pathway component PulK
MMTTKIRHKTVRHGIILPVVLVIFVLLGLLAIGFAFSTRAEYNAITAEANMIQARNCAMSGLEMGALLLRQKFADSSVWYDNPTLFRDQPVEETSSGNFDEKKTNWRYSLVACNFDSQDNVRFGITDEASKVNINTASEDQLRRLPGITPEIAAAIMDWREEGNEPRSNGAKDSYYQSLPQPYSCKKAAFDTVEELLLVKGMTGDILFGEDINRNGILDANENDGKKTLPLDNSDGTLNRGLYPYVTVYSRESDVSDSDPYQPRINIQEWPSDILKTMLPKYLRSEVVDFIVAAKKAKADFGESPANLLGLEVKDGETTISNPVTVEDMPDIMDYLTTGYHLHEDGYIYGRININTAPRTVLETIGKLTDTEIDNIISVRSRLDSESRKTVAWLLTQNVLTEEKFKQVAYLFTARSYQFMMEALGYSDVDAVQARIQAILELRLPRAQYIYWRDLSGLGRSYNIGEITSSKTVIKK